MTAAISLVGGANATATTSSAPFPWEHFGADPYATTKEQAVATREAAFRCMGLPENAIKALVAATAQAGHQIHLVNGDHLDKMVSRGCKVHVNVVVAFIVPTKHMEYAAPAEQWDPVVVDGLEYTATRPDICGNWSVTIKTAPPVHVAQTEVQCAELDVAIPPGPYVYHHFLRARRQMGKVCRGIMGDGRAIVCDGCTADDALDALRKQGYLLNSQPNNMFKFRCNNRTTGCVLHIQYPLTATYRTDDDISGHCLTDLSGQPVYFLKDIHWYSFIVVNGAPPRAYIGMAPSEWVAAGGVRRDWHLLNGVGS